MTPAEFKKQQQDMSNQELINLAERQIDNLAKTGVNPTHRFSVVG
jgi:hypothetical protein